jgi:hypothetical protein
MTNQTTTQLVDKVQSSDKKAKLYLEIALVIIVATIIGALFFIAINSRNSDRRLTTLINDHYKRTQQIDNSFAQELAAIKANHNETVTALQQQDVYLVCIATALATGNKPTCVEPFTSSTTGAATQTSTGTTFTPATTKTATSNSPSAPTSTASTQQTPPATNTTSPTSSSPPAPSTPTQLQSIINFVKGLL